MEEEVIEQSSQSNGEDFQLIKRFRIAWKGAFFRNIIRLVAGLSTLFLVGFFGLQCKLNWIGNNFANLTLFDYIKTIMVTIFFGVKRSAIMLWYYLTSIGTVNLLSNWGDLLVVAITTIFVFISVYCFVAMFADALDGQVSDSCPFIYKFLISLTLILVLSGGIYLFSEKPEGEYELNTHLFLDKYSSQICSETGKIPLFIPLDSTSQVTFNNSINKTEINDSMQII